MALSTAVALTQQFYEWEQRGRGWHTAEFAVSLEPPFAPFFGHFIPEVPIIDDGKRPSFFKSLFNPQPTTAIQPIAKEEPIHAYPYTDDTALTIFSIAIPKQSKIHSEQMEQLLIMLLYRNSPMSFELIGTPEEIVVQLTCRNTDSGYVQTQVNAFFPDFGIQETTEDYIEDLLRAELYSFTIDFGLKEECVRPLAQLQGDKECLTAFFGILNRLKADDCVILQILFSGTRMPWAEHMLNAVYDNDKKGCFFFDEPEMLAFAKDKVSRPLCAATVRLLTFADNEQSAYTLLDHAVTAIVHSATSTSNTLMPLLDTEYSAQERVSDILLRESRRVGMLINSKELTNLAHFPLVPLTKTAQDRTTKAIPDTLLGYEYCIGLNEHQGIESDITLSAEQRLRHLHIIGVTGTGKSTLLHSLMSEDVRLGNGFMCLDPHGDLIDMLLETIPHERIKDVVLIDPSDSEFPIGFNILSAHSELEKELLASDLVALFRRFSTSWGDQMNSVFANAILAFLYNRNGGTLADLRRFLIETPFRNNILSSVTDPDITYYWQHEYPLLKSSSIGSILTRLDTFLRPRTIRNMVCQKESLDFAHLMDNQKIILVKLSQGLLGAENSFLLGAFIVSKLQQIAMSRQAQAKADRIPFYCYIDEFHHFVTPSMSEILTGARKYGLGLILAHQTMQQVQQHDTAIAESVVSAGTRICFRVNDTDAKRLQEGFASFSADDLQNLSIGEAIMRVNTASNDCSLTVLPYDHTTDNVKEDIIAYSRERYSKGIPNVAQEPVPEPPTVKETKPVPSPVAQEPIQPEPVQETTIVKPVAVQSKTPEPPPVPIKEPGSTEPQPTEQANTVRRHRYLQTFIKKLAEGNGYKAQLEVKTPDGLGQVDVVLEKNGERIAIEASVSTDADWELHNIQKCLKDSYKMIAVCSDDQRKLQRIKQKIHDTLTATELSRVRVITTEDIPTLFSVSTGPAETVTTMKGYRVHLKYEAKGKDIDKEDIIKRILAGRKK